MIFLLLRFISCTIPTVKICLHLDTNTYPSCPTGFIKILDDSKFSDYIKNNSVIVDLYVINTLQPSYVFDQSLIGEVEKLILSTSEGTNLNYFISELTPNDLEFKNASVVFSYDAFTYPRYPTFETASFIGSTITLANNETTLEVFWCSTDFYSLRFIQNLFTINIKFFDFEPQSNVTITIDEDYNDMNIVDVYIPYIKGKTEFHIAANYSDIYFSFCPYTVKIICYNENNYIIGHTQKDSIISIQNINIIREIDFPYFQITVFEKSAHVLFPFCKWFQYTLVSPKIYIMAKTDTTIYLEATNVPAMIYIENYSLDIHSLYRYSSINSIISPISVNVTVFDETDFNSSYLKVNTFSAFNSNFFCDSENLSIYFSNIESEQPKKTTLHFLGECIYSVVETIRTNFATMFFSNFRLIDRAVIYFYNDLENYASIKANTLIMPNIGYSTVELNFPNLLINEDFVQKHMYQKYSIIEAPNIDYEKIKITFNNRITYSGVIVPKCDKDSLAVSIQELPSFVFYGLCLYDTEDSKNKCSLLEKSIVEIDHTHLSSLISPYTEYLTLEITALDFKGELKIDNLNRSISLGITGNLIIPNSVLYFKRRETKKYIHTLTFDHINVTISPLEENGHAIIDCENLVIRAAVNILNAKYDLTQVDTLTIHHSFLQKNPEKLQIKNNKKVVIDLDSFLDRISYDDNTFLFHFTNSPEFVFNTPINRMTTVFTCSSKEINISRIRQVSYVTMLTFQWELTTISPDDYLVLNVVGEWDEKWANPALSININRRLLVNSEFGIIPIVINGSGPMVVKLNVNSPSVFFPYRIIINDNLNVSWKQPIKNVVVSSVEVNNGVFGVTNSFFDIPDIQYDLIDVNSLTIRGESTTIFVKVGKEVKIDSPSKLHFLNSYFDNCTVKMMCGFTSEFPTIIIENTQKLPITMNPRKLIIMISDSSLGTGQPFKQNSIIVGNLVEDCGQWQNIVEFDPPTLLFNDKEIIFSTKCIINETTAKSYLVVHRERYIPEKIDDKISPELIAVIVLNLIMTVSLITSFTVFRKLFGTGFHIFKEDNTQSLSLNV